jgi:cytochrome P450
LGNLKLTKMIFDEALRLYPPVWTMSRTAQEDDKIGAMPIKKGTNVMLCPFAVHRRPEYWANPEGFDPMRFDEANGPVRRYSYFPFGVGARSCMGERFGTMESVIIIAMILQKFKLALVPGQTVVPEPMITLRPRDSIYMSLSDA